MSGHKTSKGLRGRPPSAVDRAKDKSRVLGGRLLDDYLSDLSKYEPISAAEEQELFRRYRAGDKSVKEKIIHANLRFVIKVARMYCNQGMPFIDLISEGNAGLVHAIDKFDPDKNFKFISYAVWWIRQSILRALSNQSRTTSIPLNQTQKIVRINKSYDKLAQQYGRMPSVEEVARDTGISVKNVRLMMRVATPSVSMESKANFKDNDDVKIGDVLTSRFKDPLEELLSKSTNDDLQAALNTLTDKERRIIEQTEGLIDGCEYTLQEVGNRMGVSRERVRQLRERALEKLRSVLQCEEN